MERLRPTPVLRPGHARAAQRAELVAEVTLESGHAFYVGFTGNVSAGGLFVACDVPLAVGTLVHLHFSLPSGEVVDTEGEVRWVRPPEIRSPYPAGMGVRFSGLADDAQRAVEAYVAEHSALFYDDED